MKQYTLILAMIPFALHAREVSSEKLGLKITFPDAAGWTPLKHEQTEQNGVEVQAWSSQNQASKQILSLLVFDGGMRDAKPVFKEFAEESGRVLKKKLTGRVSSRFSRLGGHVAYEIRGAAKSGAIEIYKSFWLVRIGNTQYNVTRLS